MPPTSAPTPTPPLISSENAAGLRSVASRQGETFWYVAWAPSGSTLAIAVWDEDSIETTDPSLHESVQISDRCAFSVAFDSAGEQLYLGSCDQDAILVLSAGDGRVLRKLEDEEGSCDEPMFLAVAPGDESLYSASALPGLGKDIAYLCKWDIKSGRATLVVYQRAELETFDVSQDGSLISIGFFDAEGDSYVFSQLRMASTGELLCTFPGAPLAAGPDGNRLALYEYERERVSFWDGKTCEKVLELNRIFPHPSTNYRMSFSPDGELIAIASRDIMLFETETGRLIASRTPCAQRDYCEASLVRFSPDGRRLVSLFPQRIDIWEIVAEAESE
jgi:WD40 repeat protein